MDEKNIDLVKPRNENVTIWRYMDFTKFASLLDKQALFFVRASPNWATFRRLFKRAFQSDTPQGEFEFPELEE